MAGHLQGLRPVPLCAASGGDCVMCSPGPCGDRINGSPATLSAIDACVGAMVRQRLIHARGKHPLFAEGEFNALGVIGAEMTEFIHAVEHESPERAEDEALDVIATCWRFLCGEHETEAGHA